MADSKVTALTAATAVTADDLFYVVDDPAGTPTGKKATASLLRDFSGMALASASPTTADIAPAVNTLTVADLSGLTASRNFTLPATAAAGDRVGVVVSVTHASNALILKADTGDGILASGTTYTAAEWTRVWIVGEVVIFRCIVANTTWIVEYDGRIPCSGGYYISTGSAATGGAGTIYLLTAFPSATGTAFTGVGFVASGGQVTTRRAGVYNVVSSYAATSISDAKYASAFVYVNGAVAARNQMAAGAGAAGYRFVGWQGTIAVGQTVDGRVRAEDANSGIVATESYWFATEVI